MKFIPVIKAEFSASLLSSLQCHVILQKSSARMRTYLKWKLAWLIIENVLTVQWALGTHM